MGIRVADAFIAIFDHDNSNFGYMNGVIFNLAESLGIDAVIKPYGFSLKWRCFVIVNIFDSI